MRIFLILLISAGLIVLFLPNLFRAVSTGKIRCSGTHFTLKKQPTLFISTFFINLMFLFMSVYAAIDVISG